MDIDETAPTGIWAVIVLPWGSPISVGPIYYLVAKTHFHFNPSLPPLSASLYRSHEGISAIWLEHLRSLLPFPLRSQLSSETLPTAGVCDCSRDTDLGNQPCLSRQLRLDDLQNSLPTTTTL